MEEIVILSAVRTAIGKYGKTLTDIKASDLGAIAIRDAVAKAGIEPTAVDECLMGNVLSAGLGQNPARQAARAGGLPDEIGSATVNMVCGSGMKAVMMAANAIKAGEHQLVVAGGMQTNSNLMDEMKKIVRVAKPDLIMFVGDSLAGNDAVEQARQFDAAVGIDAVFLTKIDADSKGGAALSIAHTIGKPIAFVSNGQEYHQIIKFDVDWMIDRLFD